MVDKGKPSNQSTRPAWRPKRVPWGFWRTISGFWAAVAAITGTIAALVTILAYVDVWETRGFFESDRFDTTVVRANAMHIGNAPERHNHEFFGPDHSLRFDAPNVDLSQGAVLTFEVADLRTQRHIELNGTLLPDEPDIRNAGYDTWDTIFIVIARGVLRPTGNELRIVSLNQEGGTTGEVDDILFRNIAVLYRAQ